MTVRRALIPRFPARAGLAASALVFFALGLAPSAWAVEPPCPTWFPDFRCDRHGRYEGFTAPISQPFLFEDPFITTEASLYGIWHEFPDQSALKGGDAWAIALQLRVAITDKLAFVAGKDGYTWIDPGSSSPIDETDGWNNLGFGLKYALIDNRESNFILTPSVRFEVPTGQSAVFQNWGKGAFIPGLSAAWGIGNFHMIGDVGGMVPFDHSKQTSQFFFHAHFDYMLWEHFVPLIEFAGYYYTGDGNGKIDVPTTNLSLEQAQTALGTGGFDLTDIANIGSKNVANTILATMGVGARMPITHGFSLGAIYEFPISGDKWLFEQRVTMNLMWEY